MEAEVGSDIPGPEHIDIDSRIAHAQAVYTRRNLEIYDKLVLGLFCSVVWRCPAREMRRLYDRSVGNRHLDIGPGTGYFVDRCHFPTPQPEITLLDLSSECLKMSAERLARYRPATCQANLMCPLPLPPRHFDSAGMNLVFHTIPGGWEGKGVIFKHVAETLRPGGTLFGTTVLAEGVPMNRLTRKMLLAQYERGNFQNQGDDPDGLRHQLAKYFPEYQVRTRGTVAIFEAAAG
jgi:ubiquinone/menaquinone biosynthesis C-methylase UbiE